MISAGVEGRLPYMTYPEPWGGPPKQPPEFLRPAPKPLPPARYNGVTLSNSLNGTRLVPPQRPPSKYPSPPAIAPVNLTQHKEEVTEELQYSAYSRLFHPPPPFTHYAAGPYASLYQPPYTPLLRTTFVPPPPLSPLETPYTPTTPSASNTATFLSPSSTFSPPVVVQPGQTVLRAERKPSPSFKVPSGKEGSLKHRILTRPGDTLPSKGPLDLQKTTEEQRVGENHKKRLVATVSPPRSPAKPQNNNVVQAGNFTKGSLIQLANGELRKVEDMRTEDFVHSAERSPELRLADSTVVKIKDNTASGFVTVTLSYNQRRTQVEFDATLEHPFFVYGQGWASCAPERTLQMYGLKVHRLHVGDILISLTPREPNNTSHSRGVTMMTTATTTAVTAREISYTGSQSQHFTSDHTTKSILGISHGVSQRLINQQTPIKSSNQTVTHLAVTSASRHRPISQAVVLQSVSPDSLTSKKRRWSAPDQICDEDEQIARKLKT